MLTDQLVCLFELHHSENPWAPAVAASPLAVNDSCIWFSAEGCRIAPSGRTSTAAFAPVAASFDVVITCCFLFDGQSTIRVGSNVYESMTTDGSDCNRATNVCPMKVPSYFVIEFQSHIKS